MDPGELDKKVSLVRQVPQGRDAVGAPITYPAEVTQVWAKVIYPGGREFLANDGRQTERRVVFRVWARSDLDTGTIIRFGDVDHDVQDVRPFDDVTEIHTIAHPPEAT